MSTRFTTETIPAGAPDEVVTDAKYRLVDLPGRRRTGRADHPRQRPRPHQAEHLRPRGPALARRRRSTRPRPRRPPARSSPSPSPASRSSSRSAPTSPASRSWPTATEARGHRRGSATRCSAASASWRCPSFAFVNGAAMGGGLEVALHCTYRTLSTGAAALALPEVFLGLIPGWGGAYLLPEPRSAPRRRRQGHHREPAAARTGMLKPSRTRRARHRRRRCSSPPTSSSSRCAGRPTSSRGTVVVERPDVDRDARPGTPPSRGARALRRRQAARRHPGAVPRARPRRRRHAPRTRDEGFAAEDDALADLVMGDELRGGPLRVRPRAAARQAPGRRARQVASPARSPRSASSAPASWPASSRCCSRSASRCRSS